MKKKIFLSDFDGTLTTKDSMMQIILFQRGWWGLIIALLCISPWLILMFLHLYTNERSKQRLLYHCFGGMSENDFNDLCQRFADSNRHILRQSLYDKLMTAKHVGDEVAVVTASPENWVSRMVPEFKVIGTKLEFTDKGFTGRFLTPNCYGGEKVKRIIKEYPDINDNRQNWHITAYGDSRGDYAMLAIADQGELIKTFEP